MVISNNPFAMLAQDDDDEEQVPVVKAVAKSLPVEPVKQRVIPGLAAPEKKKIVLKESAKQADQTPFIDAPVHPKEKAELAKPRAKKTDRKPRGLRSENVAPGDKKAVAGKGTWGGEQDGQVLGENDASADAPEGEEDAVVEEAVPEPEDSYKSLADYIAEKSQQKTPQLVVAKARVANEGADTTQWKDVTLVEKASEEEVFFVGKKTQEKERKVKEKAKTTTLEIEQRFAAPARDRDSAPRRDNKPRENKPRDSKPRENKPRGDKPRGDKPRDGKPRENKPRDSKPRTPTGTGAPVNVADTAAFPSLG